VNISARHIPKKIFVRLSRSTSGMPTRTGVVGTSAITASKAKATYEYLAGDQKRSTPTDEATIPRA
jgi:hypothetical protein